MSLYLQNLLAVVLMCSRILYIDQLYHHLLPVSLFIMGSNQ